jgi:hypothetical protein
MTILGIYLKGPFPNDDTVGDAVGYAVGDAVGEEVTYVSLVK